MATPDDCTVFLAIFQHAHDCISQWTLLLFSSVVQALFFFFVKETYGPHLLVLKAKKMRAKVSISDGPRVERGSPYAYWMDTNFLSFPYVLSSSATRT